MYVCVCNAVTERDIAAAHSAGATRLRDLREQLGVAAECGRCAECAQSCLRQLNSAHAPQAPVVLHFSRGTHHEGRQEGLAAA
ncbi:MAG: (2Fe-2S)-binding protein [Rhodocyclaceae bacterium]